jgi:hypothetical protein
MAIPNPHSHPAEQAFLSSAARMSDLSCSYKREIYSRFSLRGGGAADLPLCARILPQAVALMQENTGEISRLFSIELQ